MPNKSKKSSPRKSPRKPQHNLSPTDPGTPLSLAGGSSSTSPGEISPIGSSTPEKSSPRKSPRKPQHNFSPTDPGTHLSLAGGSSSTSPGEISPIGSSTPEKSSPRKSQHNLSLTDPGTPLFRAGGSSSTSPGEISPPIGSVTPVTAESNLEQAERSLKELSKKGVFDEESERTSTASPAHPPGAGSFESADFEHTHPDLAHPAHHNTVDHPDHSTTAATPSKPIATAPSSSKSKLNPTVPPFHCPSSPKLNPAAPSFHRPNSPTRIRYIGGHADITPPPETVHKVPSHPHPHQEGETEQRPTTKVRYTHSGIVLGPKQGERHPKMAHYDGTEGGTEEYMEKEEDNGMDDERDKEHGKEEVRDNLDENGLKEEGKAVEEMKKNLDENGLKEEGKAMEEMKKNLDENGLKEEGKAMEEMKKNLDENGLKDEKEDEHMVKKEYGKQEGGKKVEENGKQKGNSWADIAAPSSGGMVHEGDQVDISADVPLGEVVGVKPEYEKENEEKKERKESWADIASAEVHEGEKLDISSTNPPTTTTSSSNPASSSKPPIGPYQAKPKASSSHKLHVKAPISPTSKPPPKPKDPATEELKPIKLRGKDIGVNIGDLPHQLASAPNPETAELKATKIGPKDIGTNIGDPVHQLLAHEEAEHKRLQAVKIAQRAALASMDVDIASFAAEGAAAEFKAGAGGEKKEKRNTAGHSKRPHMEEDDAHDGSEMQKPKVARHQGEDVIFSTKVEKLKDEVHLLQSELGGLKKRLAKLETAENEEQQNENGNGTKKIVRSTKFMDENETGDLDKIMKWGMWGGMIVAVATIGGWLGAAVERGAVGRGVAEWVWRQTAKSV